PGWLTLTCAGSRSPKKDFVAQTLFRSLPVCAGSRCRASTEPRNGSGTTIRGFDQGFQSAVRPGWLAPACAGSSLSFQAGATNLKIRRSPVIIRRSPVATVAASGYASAGTAGGADSVSWHETELFGWRPPRRARGAVGCTCAGSRTNVGGTNIRALIGASSLVFGGLVLRRTAARFAGRPVRGEDLEEALGVGGEGAQGGEQEAVEGAPFGEVEAGGGDFYWCGPEGRGGQLVAGAHGKNTGTSGFQFPVGRAIVEPSEKRKPLLQGRTR